MKHVLIVKQDTEILCTVSVEKLNLLLGIGVQSVEGFYLKNIGNIWGAVWVGWLFCAAGGFESLSSLRFWFLEVLLFP